MSLALPYPSMVFVPLDVLTADEMNQIVANYEFISDQFPIESDNIDWPTLCYTVAISANSTTTLTFDPNCIYLVMYTILDKSGMFLVQARSNVVYVNDMTEPAGETPLSYTTSGLTVTLASHDQASRIVSVKMMGSVSW